MTDKTKGVLFILFAAFGYAFMSIFVKLSGDIPIVQKVFTRNLLSMIVSGIMIISNKDLFFGKKEHRKQLLLRSSLGVIGMLLFFYSITNLVAADANMLNKLSSFFLIIFSALFLREKFTKFHIVIILIAFAGSLFIIKPSFNFVFLPYLTSILAAMFAAGAYTVVRSLRQKESSSTIVFFFSIFTVVVLLPFVIMNFELPQGIQWLYLFLMSVGATIGQFGTTLAYKYAPAKEISIFSYSNVIFVTLFSIPLLGEFPDYLSFMGYGIIFIASYIMFRHNKNGKTT